MKAIARWLIARLREPSTYAGLAAVLVAFHVSDATSWANNLTTFGIGLSGLVAMAAQETKLLD